jgi:hypothetical protein
MSGSEAPGLAADAQPLHKRLRKWYDENQAREFVMLFMILLGLSLAPANFSTALQPAAAASQAVTVVPPFAVEETRKDCPNPATRHADEDGRGARARRLDELPPGRLEYAVFREVGGCAIPAVVHENVGRANPPEEGRR